MKFLILFIFINQFLFSTNNEELLSGAKLGNLALVKRAVESKADLEARNEEGETALILASWYGSPEIVDFLIKNGAMVNARDREGFTAIAKASSLGIGRHFEIVESLISASANLNLKTKEGLTAYILAKINGHAELAKVLLKAGAVEETFFSKEEASREILHSSWISDKNRFIYASYFKPDFNFQGNEGISPIMYASRNGNKFLALFLIRKSVKLDLQDKSGKTALMYAARRGQKDIVSLLIDKGADITLKDKEGNDALSWAEKFGEKDTAKILRILLD
jgi:ankyrin repeat protein